MKIITFLLSILILTSCTSGKNLAIGLKEKMKDLANNPCYNKETKAVEIGCKK
jgi:hypothetical protein|tara:strand:+ start:309 stop:467 length:159 start_codon:yes stop_codon:yes gene_type:complete